MEYNDEQLLSVENYQLMAKAYSNELKKRGFTVVQVDNEETNTLAQEIFDQLINIKSILLMLGGFLNTGKFYSLNERQIRKISILFDVKSHSLASKHPRDKTKGFLSFLSCEFCLIKNLINLSEKSNFEAEIKKLVESRLSLLSQILAI